jgi:DNA-binding NarL/FixJ family response regulator
MMIRVFVVDDHPAVRIGHRHLLRGQSDFDVCGEAGTATEALERIEASQPDLVLLDICLGDESSLDMIRCIRERCPATKILVVSYLDEFVFAERALRAGAHGYIQKSESPERLLQAMRAVQTGNIFLSGEAAGRILKQTVGSKSHPSTSSLANLTDREFSVFQLIAQGLRDRMIAEKLDLSPRTIETYRESIRKKLGLRSNAELIRFAAQWFSLGAAK